MRFMILIQADQDSEAGKMPGEQMLRDMGNFNQQLVDAGIMLAGEGLHPTAKGARVHFDHGKVSVTEGPFPLSDKPLAGFWLWECTSKQEAIDWVKKVPMPMQSGVATIELRQIFEAEDFGAEFTPELREQEEKMRAELAGKQGG
ncbi:MAG: YciI family protein [Massilia sp.]